MISSSHKTFYALGLTSLAIGASLFIYQNVFYEKHKLSKQTTVYIANQDIPLNTELTANMFDIKSVPKVSIVGKTVVDFSTVEGSYSKFTIAEGSILASTQVSDEKSNVEGEFMIPLSGDYISNVSVDDDVAIFVLLENGKEREVKKVFSSKRIYSKHYLPTEAMTSEEAEITYYIKVTQYELQAFFEASSQGEIIIAKRLFEYEPINHYSNEFTGVFEAETDNLLEHFSPDWIMGSNIEIQSGEESSPEETVDVETSDDSTEDSNSSSDRGTLIYTASKGDTWEVVASKFKTDVNTLKTLNPSVVEIDENLVLIVPAI